MKPILLSYVKTEPLVSSGFFLASLIRVSRKTQLQYLQKHGGYCDLGDKSDAEEIKRRFEVSKKNYKKAIGDLYKRHLISIESDGIYLQKTRE